MVGVSEVEGKKAGSEEVGGKSSDPLLRAERGEKKSGSALFYVLPMDSPKTSFTQVLLSSGRVVDCDSSESTATAVGLVWKNLGSHSDIIRF
jgi:hypothetical protein